MRSLQKWTVIVGVIVLMVLVSLGLTMGRALCTMIHFGSRDYDPLCQALERVRGRLEDSDTKLEECVPRAARGDEEAMSEEVLIRTPDEATYRFVYDWLLGDFAGTHRHWFGTMSGCAPKVILASGMNLPPHDPRREQWKAEVSAKLTSRGCEFAWGRASSALIDEYCKKARTDEPIPSVAP